MRFLLFLRACCKAYRISRNAQTRIGYFAVTSHGVPQITVIVAIGREAWRVSQLAAEAFALIPVKPKAGISRG